MASLWEEVLAAATSAETDADSGVERAAYATSVSLCVKTE